MPTGDMINNYFSNSGGAPTWVAVSDGGLGFIPWGFWQIAIYPTGHVPAGLTENLSFGVLQAGITDVSASVAGQVFGKFSQLRAQGVAAGFKRASEFKIGDRLFDVSSPNPGGSVTIDAPYGVTNLQGFYSGPEYPSGVEQELPMILVSPGYDNPLFLALWSPGNRAILPLSEPPFPSRYGGYPYPGQPPLVALPVDLRTAGAFEVLAKTGITNVPTSVITGQMGVSPAAASTITGWALTLDGGGQFSTSAQVSGHILAADYAVPTPATMTQAILDMQAAYTDASSRPPDVTNLGGGSLGGNTLTPGVYKWTSALGINTSITLAGDASSVFIFIVTGNMTIAAAQQVILSGGVLPQNVFWAVAGTFLGVTTSHIRGTILGQTSISFQAGALLTGKAFAQSAVNFISTTAN
jgi:hypothetical protein